MIKRMYAGPIRDHLARFRQMVFLTGPRQVGKTTLSRESLAGYDFHYLNWDNINDKPLILEGFNPIFQQVFGDTAPTKPRAIIFDEIHKYRQWKNLLKGYFDSIDNFDLENKIRIIVTGSAKLNVYRQGGDSMMGRYFLYRIHPLSVAECNGSSNLTQETNPPLFLPDEQWDALIKWGGFPEPFLAASDSFYQRWQNLKQEQLFQEDLREISKIHDISRLQLLAQFLAGQVGSVVRYSELAKKIRVSEPTVRAWVDTLISVYYCFTIKPWSQNVTRSLIKDPKVYLWDWSMIHSDSSGARIENFVAHHLLKAAHWWTDIGLGKYELFYLRDKEKREVDFLICKNNKPWLMIEVKSSDNKRISKNLEYFYQELKPDHAFQLVYDMPYQDIDCFALKKPHVVSMRTLLSQLV
jgi:predicted AAA+ superfamily ATPase